MTHQAASRLGDAAPASVQVHAVNGFVVKELVDASHDADLVVLGARGGSGFARLPSGSTRSHASGTHTIRGYESATVASLLARALGKG